MLDAALTAQLRSHLERLVHPIELVSSLDDSNRSAQLAELLSDRRQRDRRGEARPLVVGQDPEPRVGVHRDRVVLDRVLAVAEEDEVGVEEPPEEEHRLLDLVLGVGGQQRVRHEDAPGAARA